jgi:putative phosphoribosyl transferase
MFPAGSDTVGITLTAAASKLPGELQVPKDAAGVVIFAHGIGSGKQSPQNRFVAEMLHRVGIGTLLFDLLTPDEVEADKENRRYGYDVPLLAERLSAATAWVIRQKALEGLPLGYYGSSAAVAASMVASCDWPEIVAIVSRGGRPDLAGPVLGQLLAPTLLIVGAKDHGIIELNHKASHAMRCESQVEVVPGASRRFSEPGALTAVGRFATRWFIDNFRQARLAATARRGR